MFQLMWKRHESPAPPVRMSVGGFDEIEEKLADALGHSVPAAEAFWMEEVR